jgi:hypothetical protein
MTNQEIAEKIVALFAALGFPARTEAMDDSLDSVKVFVGAAPERYAFLVFPSGVASGPADGESLLGWQTDTVNDAFSD